MDYGKGNIPALGSSSDGVLKSIASPSVRKVLALSGTVLACRVSHLASLCNLLCIGESIGLKIGILT